MIKILFIRKKGEGKIPEKDNDGNVELIYIKDFKGYSKDEKVKAGIGLWNSNQFHRWYINPECFAGLLGAMLDLNIDFLVFNGSSTIDGGAGGSKSHINGIATDIGYFRKDKKPIGVLLEDKELDMQLNIDFINALIDYGYRDKRRFFTQIFVPFGESQDRLLVEGMGISKNPPHNNHLHIDGFIPDLIKIVNNKELEK